MEPKELYQIFDKRYKEEILPYVESKLPRDYFSEPVYYYIDNFHLRRFRAVLPLLIAEHTVVRRENALSVGTASELVFTLALIQDDFIDDDMVRGVIPTAHEKYGAQRALTSADYAYCAVFDMLSDLYQNDIPDDTLQAVIRGFMEAHRSLYRSFLTELGPKPPIEEVTKEYVRRVHLDKTVQGINALYCMGTFVDRKRGGKLAQAFKRYAELLGIAGQIKNDVYDFTRYSETRGFSDLHNGYVTYPIAHLAEVNDRACLSEIVKKKDADAIQNLMKEHKVVEELQKEINEFVDQAVSIIKGTSLPAPLKEILESWAEGNRLAR